MMAGRDKSSCLLLFVDAGITGIVTPNGDKTPSVAGMRYPVTETLADMDYPVEKIILIG